MKRIEFGAILVLAALSLAGAACGNPLTTAEETQTAVAGAQTPAGTATGTPIASASPNYPPGTRAPEPTPQAVTPVPAATAGRTDCPSDWNSYMDPDQLFSICFPAGWTSSQRRPGDGYSAAAKFEDAGHTVYVGLTIVEDTPLTSGAVSSLAELCRAHASASGIEFTAETIALGNTSAQGCVGHGDAGEAGFDPIVAWTQLPDGRFIAFNIARSSPAAGVGDVIDAVLTTVRVS
jgi:hypothetical protein